MFMYFVLYLTWTFAYSYVLNIFAGFVCVEMILRHVFVSVLSESHWLCYWLVNNWSLSEQRLNKSHPTNVFYFVRVLSHLQWLKARVCAEREACQELGVYREVQLCGAEKTRDSRSIGQKHGLLSLNTFGATSIQRNRTQGPCRTTKFAAVSRDAESVGNH